MCSTSLSCLYALNAKKRCGIVYLRWTQFLQYYAFFATFILLFQLSLAQKTTVKKYSTGFQGTNIGAEDLTSKEIPDIHPFYNEHSNMKLNITFKNFAGTQVQGYTISVYRFGPPNLDKCNNASQHYELLNNDSNIIIPNTETQNSFLLSRCKYMIEIIYTPRNEAKVLKINYTIPGTSMASNITVFPFYDEENNGIKINLTWENPKDALLPTHYQIKMSPFKDDRDHCKENTKFQELFKPAKISYVTLPEDVVPGCSYEVEVVEQPSNDLNSPRINYTVPDCVEMLCICQYKKQRPPAPIIKIQEISKNVIRISWRIPKLHTMDNLTMIKFRVFLHQHITPLVLHTRNITDKDVDVEMKENVTLPEIPPGNLIIQVWYTNASFCDSAPTRIEKFAQHALMPHWTHQIMVLTMFILMVIVVLCLLWKRKLLCLSSTWISYRLRGQHTETQPHIRRIYRSTTERSHTRSYLAVPMEYNNLYVEKEIADEFARGKVDKFEMSYKRLQFERKIGGGAFGEVFLARTTAIAGNNLVAVKKLGIETASPEELEEFLLEIAMLKRIGQHPNIVTLLGCCTLHQPFCMIMEYVPCGDLLRYLRALRLQYERKGKAFLFTINKNFDTDHLSDQDKQKISDCSYITPESIPFSRLPSVTETEYTLLGSDLGVPDTPEELMPRNHIELECSLDPYELQNFAMQIARGMQYLEQKQIVHRDLAARNVLIDENKTLKISDFGLSRSGIYVNSKQKKLPLRWLSIEAIRDNLYTNKSDVWAYGIVLWEISTLGGFPYPTVANHEILEFLLKGKRLEKPENCTDELFILMQQCWSHTKEQRPSFTELVDSLEVISSNRRVYVDFNQLNPSYVFPPTEEQAVSQVKTEYNIKTRASNPNLNRNKTGTEPSKFSKPEPGSET